MRSSDRSERWENHNSHANKPTNASAQTPHALTDTTWRLRCTRFDRYNLNAKVQCSDRVAVHQDFHLASTPLLKLLTSCTNIFKRFRCQLNMDYRNGTLNRFWISIRKENKTLILLSCIAVEKSNCQQKAKASVSKTT